MTFSSKFDIGDFLMYDSGKQGDSTIIKVTRVAFCSDHSQIIYNWHYEEKYVKKVIVTLAEEKKCKKKKSKKS